MRAPNWQAELLEVFESARGRRFRWGFHDCCQFVRRCAIAVRGEPPRTFPRYRTKSEALALLATHGGMQGLLTHAFGEPVHVSKAGMGDVVLVDMGMGPQPAVCMGLNCFAPGMKNLHHRPTSSAAAAWML